MKKPYYYSTDIYNTRAAEAVVPVIMELFSPASILDVGCGLGTWLKVFKDHYNISEIAGVDQKNQNNEIILIDPTTLIEKDLAISFNLARRFDLVISLEVAEHLPYDSSVHFIESLCLHSDLILFSAAIPGQGGQHHINEQWPEFWEHLFDNFGYKKYDLIRPFIWDNENVDIWYRQNMYIYSCKEIDLDIVVPVLETIIHPDYWKFKVEQLNQLKYKYSSLASGHVSVFRAFKLFIKSVLHKFGVTN